ncbi:ornithine cyclodeaminase family protein [Natrononativus amylolyticus]|uniref:ornithine cyclodeaminase family protein n=1 Tax=Natrononativus amylolyticus TaxID=2963434 RepID=UPI0020CE5480|nr:ornithine cyclodeaminase family protein [Natrononativus amylolyticus]
MSPRVYTDDDVHDLLEPADAVTAMERAFEERAAGTLEAPPRWSVEAGDGALVFTVGAATGPTNAVGFRVYDTYPDSSDDHHQLVAVFDASTGAFEGLFVGHAIGRWRTGAIGGVAVDALAREDARTLGVLGAGNQARTQVESACAVREFETVHVYSPTPESREAFASEVGPRVAPNLETVEDAETAVRGADVLMCATTSTEPVFDPDWLEPGAHVTSIGPKFEDAHELPMEAVDAADIIATDSLAQVDGYDRPFVVSGADRDRMVELADVLEDPSRGRTAADDLTLFCSVGLAGTEVVLGRALLEAAD